MLEPGFYNMDCMEGIASFPDKYFDLAIVDPPYGIGCTNQAVSRKIHKKMIWNMEIPKHEYFLELDRVSKHKIIWGVNYYSGFIKDIGRIIHDKSEKNGHRFKEMSDADIASHSFGVNIKMFRFLWIGNVQGNAVNWDNNGINGRIHPTQKPVELYRWLLQNYAKQGDKILDTHVGSASSLIACEWEGFDYVGFELDEDYYRDASKRIKQWRESRTIDMFAEEPKNGKLEQTELVM